MLAMTPPPASSKVLLVPDARGGDEPTTVTLRRYRIARLRLDARGAGTPDRWAHLKRTYD